MKYGIALPDFGIYAQKEKLLEISGAAEELGYDSLWVSDHLVIPNTHKSIGDESLDPIATLTYLSANTRKIKLGTSVIVLPYQNPFVLAKSVATLDELSEGRVILGVGAGWLKDEFDALGVPFNERGSITNEYIEVVKTLWTEDDPEFRGEYVEFSDIKFLPKPLQNPHPPIWVGGGSERAMKRAATHGDGWHPVGLTPPELRKKVLRLMEQIEDSKRDPGEFTISLRRNLEITDKKDIGENETLRGTPEKIARGIEDYREAGVSHLIFQVLGGDFKGVLKTMEVFTKEIR